MIFAGYSYNIAKEKAMSNIWNKYPKVKPPLSDNPDDDYGCYKKSLKLLFVTDGRICAGYYRLWEREEGEDLREDWVLEGRDGYTMDKVTYWAKMPDFPKG
jgi:hypothetical protein